MSAAEALGLPPGVRFDPTGDELVEYYLLPRALGRPPAVPGIIIEDDDTATATAATATTSAQHPWKLLTRHRRTDDNEAYFFERIAGSTDDATKAGARQDRSCGGGRWTWVGQRRAPNEALPQRGDGDGERVSWGKYSLNLQEGRRRRGGSTGWVLHEYTVTASPQCPLLPVKLCHVSFTGHGQKRQRVPHDDGEGEGQEFSPQATQPPHKRAATGSCMVTTATAMPNQELSEAHTQNQELSEARAQDQEEQFPNYDYSTSSVGHFWSSDAGFSQESSIILDPSYPDDARSNHEEPFVLALDQQLTRNQECPASQSQAYHQEQFVNPAGSSTEAHCAVQAASDLGSSQEPPQTWNPLIEVQQFSLSQLLGGINSPCCPPTTPAAYHEQKHIQSFAPAATADLLPLLTVQESCTTQQSHGNMDQYDDFFRGWGDLNSFCDTSGIQDDNEMAAKTLAADGCGGGSSLDRHFFYQQPAF